VLGGGGGGGQAFAQAGPGGAFAQAGQSAPSAALVEAVPESLGALRNSPAAASMPDSSRAWRASTNPFPAGSRGNGAGQVGLAGGMGGPRMGGLGPVWVG